MRTLEQETSSRPGLGAITLLKASLSLEGIFSHPVGGIAIYLCQLREGAASHRGQWVRKGLGDHYNTGKSIHKKEYLTRAGKGLAFTCISFKTATGLVFCLGGCWRGGIQRTQKMIEKGEGIFRMLKYWVIHLVQERVRGLTTILDGYLHVKKRWLGGYFYRYELMGKREEEDLNRVAIYCQHWARLCICFVSDTEATPTHSPSSLPKAAQLLQPQLLHPADSSLPRFSS